MKVLHIISSSGFYGAEKVLLDITKISKDNDCSPYLMCIKGQDRPDPEIYFQAKMEGLPSVVISCNSMFDMGAIKKIRDFVRREGVSMMHAHGYKSNIYGLVASRFSKIPIVTTIHGWTGDTRKVRLYEKLDRWVIRGMDHIISVSPMISEELAVLKLCNVRATFIPNGIDTSKFDPVNVGKDLREELGLAGSIVIGSVGRLSVEKGHRYLIDAFVKVRARVPEAKLLIVGNGPLMGELKAMARSLGLADKVIFTGARNDTPLLYKSMDIFVLPSLKEGMPIALLEAMAMKLPVIASDVGGIPYVVKDGEDCVLVEQGNCEALSDKILAFVKDASLRHGIGGKARSKVTENFSSSRLYQNYYEVYKDVERLDN